MGKMTVIIPSFNEEDNIENTAKVIGETLSGAGIEYDLLFVSDGSTDKTFDIVETLSKADKRIGGIQFSRNFGKEAAMYAGLEAAKKLDSDAAIIMDVDLQDPPRLLPEFLAKHNEGYNLIYAKQRNRKGAKLFSKICSLSFYKIYAHFTGDTQMSGGARDYCLLDRKVIDAYRLK